MLPKHLRFAVAPRGVGASDPEPIGNEFTDSVQIITPDGRIAYEIRIRDGVGIEVLVWQNFKTPDGRRCFPPMMVTPHASNCITINPTIE